MNAQVLIRKGEEIVNSPLAFFIRNGHMAVLTILAALIGGLYALSYMPLESDPEVKIPVATITTVFPGASPADVEKLVTDEIEEQIKSLENVDEITSTSTEGVSSIVVEFEASADLKESIRNLRDEVDLAAADLPEDVQDDPFVKQVRAGDEPIVTFLLTGNASTKEFKQYTDDIQDMLEAIQGVNEVEVSGLPEEEMQVLLNLRLLEGYNLSPLTVSQAIARNHVDLPVGAIRSDSLYYQVSLKGQFSRPEELENLAIAQQSGETIYLKDVGSVREAFAETSTEARIYRPASDTYESVVRIQVFKRVGEDLVEIIDEAKRQLDKYKEESLPASMSIEVSDDFSQYIREDIQRLGTSAIQTIIIIAITLYLSLGRKESIAASMGIPVLYLLTLICLALVGATFNFLTFFALILTLGIAVDTCIVIIEGVHENITEHGMSSKQAALSSLATFHAPLTSGVFTTIGAFLPLAMMSGIMGEYVKHIPITVNFTLLCSLFTALMLLPPFAAWLLRNEAKEKIQKKPYMERYFTPLKAWYAGFIETLLHSKKLRKRWGVGMIIAFFVSFGMLQTGIVKFKLFSEVDAEIISIEIEAPEGTELENTKAISTQVEEIISTIPELDYLVGTYGTNGSHTARVDATIIPLKDRDRKSYTIASEFRKNLKPITEAQVTVLERESGPPGGADIELRILGDNTRAVQEFTPKIEKLLATTEGTTDVRNDNEVSPGEFHLKLKRDRLEYFGVTASDIGRLLRGSVFGDDATKIKEGGEETPIAIRMDFRDPSCLDNSLTALREAKDGISLCRNNPKDISVLLNMLIPTLQGQVPLSELADVSLEPAVTTIRHYNTQRVVRVRGDVADGYVLGDVLASFNEKLAQLKVPAGLTVAIGGENEDTAESMQSLARASIVGLLMIIGILVYQFKSFRQVVIVLATLPLAVMGVLYGLALIRIPLSFPGMIGMTALMGIVVNDAIVLIDKINMNVNHGMNLIESVIQGSRARLQPVIITTLTTALGVAPLIFSGEIFRDLAIVVSVGIVVATIFTLVMVPILYIAVAPKKLKQAATEPA